MKKLLGILMIALLAFTTSCTTVDSGHKGVKVSWGGETDMSTILPEGMNGGIHWLWDDVIEYDIREHTIERQFEFNDKNDMTTTVSVALDYNLDPNSVNKLHVGINDIDIKIGTSLSSAAKEVVPQYAAVDLNKHKRAEGEAKLAEILRAELPEFFVAFKRVRFTDINIPKGISRLAEETAVQIGRNELASKKEAEQVSLAKAAVAKSKGEFQSAEFDARTKQLLSQPAMLKLRELEVMEAFANKGISMYGNNNVFGSQTAIVKGLK
jgi:regulator of protease activity HflC (stomatin/prohibitin superfamily)